MQDASVNRLSKILSDTPSNDGTNRNRPVTSHKPSFHFHLEEGWFSLFLLAIVVYSTIWSVQAVGWVDHLNVLTLTTALGLAGGVIAAKQQRISRLYVHIIAIAFCLLLAFWQTAGAYYGGNIGALVQGFQHWIVASLAGATGEDDSIFLLLITALAFILAYTSAWLVYRTRSPWLMIVANAVVLLINLSNIDLAYVIFLIVFLMASLLLLLRINLYESIQRWRKQGLRYADDLGWDVMQAGALISIGILIVSWILPWGYTNDMAAQVWNMDANPIVQLENTWNRIISVSGGANPANHGNFRDTLVLGGNPNLNNDIVFTVKSTDDSQYLASFTYDIYDGRGWAYSPVNITPLNTGDSIPVESSYVHAITQNITVVNPPGEDNPYLFGASQLASIDQAGEVWMSKATNSVIAVMRKNGKLTAGEKYTVTSYVSSADVKTLRTVPLPADAPRIPSTLPDNFQGQIPPTYYDPSIVSTYTKLPDKLDPHILALAKQLTKDAPTMYDKAVALETYLRSFKYDVHISLPPGEEAASWFLFRSGQKGYCNYFATTMTVMARLLGIPARVVVGYTNGQLDPKTQLHVIRGTDAHAWVQVYFAGYGWINFEPSASFSTFSRPLPNQFSSTPLNGGSTSIGGTLPRQKSRLPKEIDSSEGHGNASITPQTQNQTEWRQQTGVAFGGVVLLLLIALTLFALWWKRLYRKYRVSMQIYGRMCMLANWAGIAVEPSLTPYEHIATLTKITPEESQTLERFGDIYVRELWADPQSKDHPLRTGEIRELPGMWKKLQPRFFWYVIRHPYFIRAIPARISGLLKRLSARRRAHHLMDHEL